MSKSQRSLTDKTRRRQRGFEQAVGLMAPQLQKIAERRGFAVSRLLTHWPEIAGESLARLTRPVRVRHGQGMIGATLTLLTDGAHAPLVNMQLEHLRNRINACYGYNAIQKIHLTQSSGSGFSEAQARFACKPTAPAQPPPESVHASQQIAARFDDPGLADAMARLSLNILTKSKKS